MPLDIEALYSQFNQRDKETENFKNTRQVILYHRMKPLCKEMTKDYERLYEYHEDLQALRNLAAKNINIPFKIQREMGDYAIETASVYESFISKGIKILNEFESVGLLSKSVNFTNHGLKNFGQINLNDILIQLQDPNVLDIIEKHSGMTKELYLKSVQYLSDYLSDTSMSSNDLGLLLKSASTEADFSIILTSKAAKNLVSPDELVKGKLPSIRLIKRDDMISINPYDPIIMGAWGGIYQMRNHAKTIHEIGVQGISGEDPGSLVIIIAVCLVVGIVTSIAVEYGCKGSKSLGCKFLEVLRDLSIIGFMVSAMIFSGKAKDGKIPGWGCSDTSTGTTKGTECRPIGA